MKNNIPVQGDLVYIEMMNKPHTVATASIEDLDILRQYRWIDWGEWGIGWLACRKLQEILNKSLSFGFVL
jgi:hypothetical protein